LYPVSKIKITFAKNSPKSYKIVVNSVYSSTTGSIVASDTNNTKDVIETSFTEQNIRYAFILMPKMNGNPAIYEFEVLKRELPPFDGTATLTSQSYNSDRITRWTSLDWDETTPTGTDIAFAVQTSNDGATWSAWQLKSNSSPIDLSTLPLSRYIRWQSELTTNTLTPPITTPILHEARVFYEQEDAQKLVKMNELLPNPEGVLGSVDFGQDGDLMSKGEWIELYNNSAYNIDLAGFYFQNASGTKKYISSANILTGNTVINSQDWLVVYMNGEFMNNGGDTIGFYDLWGNQIDGYSYDLSNACNLLPTPDATNSTAISGDCTTVPANKSFARIPDGTGAWVDPIPTPGTANVLEVLPVDEFVDKLNDLLVTPTSSEATTTQEIAELPME
ncbi:MAG TPA: lamin tail domain-containing protein, partial [Candidatus Gracilibacteria bacterium]|nr:lamin tail domain-containing protein [Candidatus Gracilibacteria bacterium]